MSHFDRIPITKLELMLWKRNKLINPRTNRTIKNNCKLFKLFESSYNDNFPEGFDIFDSNDCRDPVSLNAFYSIDNSGNKILEYSDIDNLILYRESEEIIRCFEKNTLKYLKKFKIYVHPVSQSEIPVSIFENIEEVITEDEISVDEKALQVFQLFTDISIFIDYKKFLNLNKHQLIKLNYEIKDFYYQNFSLKDRQKIDNDDGNQYLQLSDHELRNKEIDDIKMYLLNQIENLLKYKKEDLKFMINYIILGGLSLFIEEVKELYDNFNFSF